MERSSQRRAGGSGGFTLLEMLVVIVIIVALMGLVFKLTGKASDSANRAATVKKLERLRAAIEEYHTTYGTYPQCSSTEFCDLSASGFSPEVLEEVLQDLDDGKRVYGLCAYLEGNEKSGVMSAGSVGMGAHSGYEMTEEDKEFVRRIRPYVAGLADSDIRSLVTPSGKAYTNIFWTYLDGWNNQIVYKCPPPYVSYELYSCGPDGNAATRDDNIEGGLDL